MFFKKHKIISITLSMLMILTATMLSGCEILNELPPAPADDYEYIAEEPVSEPELDYAVQQEPEVPELSAWERRLASWPMAFGFANEEGSKLILVNYDFIDLMEANEAPVIQIEAEEPEEEEDSDYMLAPADKPEFLIEAGFDPDTFSLAIGPYSDIKPITFRSWQRETAQNNNRDNVYNFKNLPGFVYAQKEWALSRNKTYVLTNMGPLVESTLVLGAPGWKGNTPPMAEETLNAIERQKNRSVVWGKTLATTKVGGGEIGVVLFERQGNDMLFSIAYIDDNKTLFWDCPAQYDASSTWRVDAGEEPGVFEPMFLARFDEGLLLMLTWGSAEGETILLLREEDGAFVQTEIDFARYWGA